MYFWFNTHLKKKNSVIELFLCTNSKRIQRNITVKSKEKDLRQFCVKSWLLHSCGWLNRSQELKRDGDQAYIYIIFMWDTNKLFIIDINNNFKLN